QFHTASAPQHILQVAALAVPDMDAGSVPDWARGNVGLVGRFQAIQGQRHQTVVTGTLGKNRLAREFHTDELADPSQQRRAGSAPEYVAALDATMAEWGSDAADGHRAGRL